jgi:hypothetical protein
MVGLRSFHRPHRHFLPESDSIPAKNQGASSRFKLSFVQPGFQPFGQRGGFYQYHNANHKRNGEPEAAQNI